MTGTGRVVVVGLGPAGPELVDEHTRDLLETHAHRFTRTIRHPAAAALSWTATFDGAYEGAASFEEVYGRIVDSLVEAAGEHGSVLYAVPGSPAVAEASVEMLRCDPRVEVEVHPALSFLDLAWIRLGIDPVAAAVRLVDGASFATQAAGQVGPLLVAQCWSPAILAELSVVLGSQPAPPPAVTVLQRLGLEDEAVVELSATELDRVEADHLTTLFLPRLARPVAAELVALDELVRTLRRRCPWDREQTHRSLERHLIEETYEVLDAIDGLDGSPASYGHLEEELGDLLFQVLFHSTLAAEEGQFDVADVARGVHDKLVGRHPHVFGNADAATPEAVMANWERIKRGEKSRQSLMDGIPSALPALLRAHKVQRKAATVGIDADPGSGPDLAGGSDAEDELGRRLFEAVAEARRRGVDAEAALRAATAAFEGRFRAFETAAQEKGLDPTGMSPEEAASLWASTG